MERVWLVSYALAWLLVLVQSFFLVALLWGVGRIHLKRGTAGKVLITDEGPQLHTAMPLIRGITNEGQLVRSSDYRGREWLLLLVSPGCGPCEQLLQQVNVTLGGLPRCPEMLLVVESDQEKADSFARRHRLNVTVITDERASIRDDLGIDRTPYGLLVDVDGIVRMKGVVNDRAQLEGLVGRRGRYIGGLTWSNSSPRG